MEDKTEVADEVSSARPSETSEELDAFVKEMMDNSKLSHCFLF